jgi:hypothetical protein
MTRKGRLNQLLAPCAFVLATACSASAQTGGFGGGAAADPFSMPGVASGSAVSSSLRPWLSVNGSYGNNLNSSQQLTSLAPSAASGSAGISGSKNWAMKSLAGGYSGSISYNPNSTSSLPKWRPAQVANLSYSQQVSQRVKFSLSQMGGLSYGGYGVASSYGINGVPGTSGSYVTGGGSDGTASFGDPGINGIVDNELFNGRSVFYSGIGSVSYLMTNRLAISGSGSASIVRRDQGIRGTTSYLGSGRISYRLSQRITVGGGSAYTTSNYTGFFGNVRSLFHNGGIGYQVNPTTTVSVDAGAGQITSKFVGQVALPPEIAEIIGGSGILQVQENTSWSPAYSFSLMKRAQFGTFMAGVSRGFSTGNGLVAAGVRDMALLSFNRSLSQRVGFGLNGSASRMSDRVGVFSATETAQAGVNLSYRIVSGLSLTTSGGARYVGVPSRSHRSDIYVGIGLSWTPGELPFSF